MKHINIIGAGLAGSEAAYQLANKGYKVKLYEVKKISKNEIQKDDNFAELVCSNTLRSKSLKNAVGILKKEMELFNSLIIQAAYDSEIPGDDALAVDRKIFSEYITNKLINHPNIEIIDQDVDLIDDENEITIIASGPLTTQNLKNEIKRLIGNQKHFFLDASSPIIKKDSIDLSKVYFNSRHKTGNGDYINIPLDEKQFNNFAELLKTGETVKLKDFENEIYFKGCQPIEQLAKKGNKILLNGPMSPNNLEQSDGTIPYAVVQLRQDDIKDELYNFVGFQTNLKWPEQKRILSTLPGLQNIQIVRYGVMHKNYFINSPKILNHKLQSIRKRNVFFAGQITGVEGYVESAASGIVAALGVESLIKKVKIKPLPTTTALGGLINYITNPKNNNLKPMKANLGIIDKLDIGNPNYDYFSKAIEDLKEYIKEIK